MGLQGQWLRKRHPAGKLVVQLMAPGLVSYVTRLEPFGAGEPYHHLASDCCRRLGIV